MAGSILVKDLLYRVSKDLSDSNPQFTRWVQKELVNSLNDGQRAIAKYLPHSCARVDAVKLVPGTKQSIAKILAANIIPGDGSVAADVRGNVLQFVTRNMGSTGLTPGFPIGVVDRDMQDSAQPEWHTLTSATPNDYCYDQRTPQVFYVVPGVPATGSVWVELSMLADPIAVPNVGNEDYTFAGASTQVISIDDKYMDDLHHYIMARSHLKESEAQSSVQMASAFSQMFTSSINAQAMAMTGVNPNLQSLPFSPQFPATSR